jgi:NhaA family Na+:H+ antiporter
MKIEMRVGSLASLRKAALPCIAAVGGMLTPMLVYLIVQRICGGGSLAALTVPMATDIAFAMAVFGLFRKRMPPAASAFLLTLATVDDLGAILVLATCFASHVSLPFLGAAAAITAGLAAYGRTLSSDLRAFAAGGAALWYCLLRSGVNADIAGVLAAFCISTRAQYAPKNGRSEDVTHRAVRRLSPISTFFIMPLFALANTAVPLRGLPAAGASAAAAAAAKTASFAPALGIGAGLLLGKPIGIFTFSLLAAKLNLAALPAGMTKTHLGIVGVLGGIGFTMCLLLTEVAMPVAQQALPKMIILASSLLASLLAAAAMRALPLLSDTDKAA